MVFRSYAWNDRIDVIYYISVRLWGSGPITRIPGRSPDYHQICRFTDHELGRKVPVLAAVSMMGDSVMHDQVSGWVGGGGLCEVGQLMRMGKADTIPSAGSAHEAFIKRFRPSGQATMEWSCFISQ